MSGHFWRHSVPAVAIMAFGLLAGCGGGDEPLVNKHPGLNDLNTVMAYGDSITLGSDCDCVPYPARLAGLIGKNVVNAGRGGSQAIPSVGRTQRFINANRPAYTLILYGINDLIKSRNIMSILDAIQKMAAICKENNVVPVLATYPMPIAGHSIFAPSTLALNQGIRTIAAAEGIRCVDLEREFSSGRDPANSEWVIPIPELYESDGLHPNDAGTQVMALAFADLF